MDDICRADNIYGEATPILQGKINYTFTSSNFIKTQKPTPLHGHFLHKLFGIHTHYDGTKIPWVKSMT